MYLYYSSINININSLLTYVGYFNIRPIGFFCYYALCPHLCVYGMITCVLQAGRAWSVVALKLFLNQGVAPPIYLAPVAFRYTCLYTWYIYTY